MDLFTDKPREYDDPHEGHVIELPDTLEGRMAVFANRWTRAEVREVVMRELAELIVFALRED